MQNQNKTQYKAIKKYLYKNLSPSIFYAPP